MTGFAIGLLFAAWNYLVDLYFASDPVRVADYRISLLILAIVFLLTNLLRTRETPLLSTLVEIRRDLVFGNGNLDSLVSRADIALAGMKAADVLQEPVKAILDLLQQASRQTELAAHELESVANSLPKNRVQLASVKMDEVKNKLNSSHKRSESTQK